MLARFTAVMSAALVFAGCAAREVPPTESGAGTASAATEEPVRFEMNTAGAIGVGLLAGAVLFALLIAQDDAVSFD